MRALYARSRLLQWTVAIVLVSVFLVLYLIVTLAAAFALGLQIDQPVQLAVAMGIQIAALLPLWMLLGSVLFAPLLRLAGVLRYCSPYLVVTRSGKGKLDLHGAMIFDYFLLFRWSDRGAPAVRKILVWYVDGLLSLAREVVEGRLSIDTTLSGTSYIFSENTARRYGFDVERAAAFSWGGVLTYPTQVLTYSFARGRWTFPPVLRAKRATIDAATLCSQIPRLERMRKRLGSIHGEIPGPTIA